LEGTIAASQMATLQELLFVPRQKLHGMFIVFSIVFVCAGTHAEAQVKIKGINHIALAVEDIDRSRQFYEYIIGLKPIAVPEELKFIRAWFQIAPGQELHLLAGRKKPVHHDRNGSHISLTIDDADAIEAYLKLQSIEYHRQERFDGVSQVFITDPDGYVIEFNEARR
jgi:lactoylglutathione lyase